VISLDSWITRRISILKNYWNSIPHLLSQARSLQLDLTWFFNQCSFLTSEMFKNKFTLSPMWGHSEKSSLQPRRLLFPESECVGTFTLNNGENWISFVQKPITKQNSEKSKFIFFFFLVLGTELRDRAHFVWVGLNLWSSCLCPVGSWDSRCAPPCLTKRASALP
jgi:hypothetical protein